MLWVPAFAVPSSPQEDRPAPEGAGPGRAALKLALRDCLLLALSHNVDVEIARYEPQLEDRKIEAALGAFDHTAYSSLSGGESIAQSANPLDASDLDTDSAVSRTGIRRQRLVTPENNRRILLVVHLHQLDAQAE